MPVTLSPLRIAALIGAAPRYAGRREACKLTHALVGSSSSWLRSSCPNANTSTMSGAHAAIRSMTAGSLTFSIFAMGCWCCSHQAPIGVGAKPRRPCRRSGCVPTPMSRTEAAAINAARVRTAMAPEANRKTLIWGMETEEVWLLGWVAGVYRSRDHTDRRGCGFRKPLSQSG